MQNNNNLEIYVNGNLVDLFEDYVNLRINNILFDPTKITANTATYSYTFNLPITKTNAKIFNHINVAEKTNKFNTRYNTVIYNNNVKIFEGELKIASIEDNTFKCNIFNSKVLTLDSIFGDTTMNEISWYIPFDGVSTINEINADDSSKVFFPLVAYSLFQKLPEITTESGYRKYTSKYQIDNTNQFYFNTFVPSMNLVELLKRLYAHKGYQLQGNILNDKTLNSIYLSNCIADGQDPLYNFGNENIGKIEIDFDFKNYSGTTLDTSSMLDYYLTYPYKITSRTTDVWENSYVYPVFDSKYSTVTTSDNKSNMYINGGVQIPADGWYEITLDSTIGVASDQGELTDCWVVTSTTRNTTTGVREQNYGNKDIEYSLANMPIDLQLLKYNAADSDVSNLSFERIGYGAYPNEPEADRIVRRADGTRTSNYSITNITSSTEGQTVVTAIDVYNNPDFVCGLSQHSTARSLAYLKDGYSWNTDTTVNNNVLYNCAGYYQRVDRGSWQLSDINQNTLEGAVNQLPTYNGRTTSGVNKMIIKLRKNDVLVPFAVIRGYVSENDNPKVYKVETDGKLTVRAVAPDTIGRTSLSYNMTSKFDYDLNLGNFLNKDEKVQDFISNIQKAFNLSFQQAGDNVIMNTQKLTNDNTVPVDIDYKTNTAEAIFNEIEFPKSITVKWNIDTEEEGFYRSVEDNTSEEQIQSNNWKDYGDYGYQTVKITDNTDAKEETLALQFSYNWFRPFNVYNVETYENSNTLTFNELQIPVIGKTEWWIDGLDYEGYAKNDGRGLRQRFWFRGDKQDYKLPLGEDEYYDITLPLGHKKIDNNTIYLNYNNSNNSLLSKFFNSRINSRSEEVEIEVYLSALEYKQLTNGSNVKFNDDIYQILEISGYDPLGYNKTKLKLMKK